MEHDPEVIEQRMYRIFHIRDESYVLTVKFWLIFTWAQQSSDKPLDRIEELRKLYYRRGKLKAIERMYREAQDALLRESDRYAPEGAVPPQSRDVYISGWRP